MPKDEDEGELELAVVAFEVVEIILAPIVRPILLSLALALPLSLSSLAEVARETGNVSSIVCQSLD